MTFSLQITNDSWMEEEDEYLDAGRRIPPEDAVIGCLLQYYYVEVIHAAVQCLLSVSYGISVLFLFRRVSGNMILVGR